MINKNTELFFQFPSETDRRILHPLEIVEITDGAFTARFTEADLTPDPNESVLVYFELRREFMQQSARVTAVLETEPTTLFAFQTTSDPVSAESRECYRASAILLNVPTIFGGEQGCPLQDVSATGLAVIASTKHKIGDNTNVSFRYESASLEGTVCVQSVRELGPDRYRYGLHSIGKNKSDRDFRDALNRISLSIQRRQLKRLSGTG